MIITDVLQSPNCFSIHLPLILEITTSLPINAFIAVLPSSTRIFGLIISTVSCYFGFNATKGAEGVGYATTASVVISSVMILTSTYIITALFFG